MDEAARAELAAVVKRIVLMRCEREGQSEEEGEKAAEDSVGVLFAALDDGVPSAEAVTMAISRSVNEAAVVASALQKVEDEHGPDASPLAIAAAADAAILISESGAAANVAVAAGERAASGIIVHGETLEQVAADVEDMAAAVREKVNWEVVTPPGWTLGGWLKSLQLQEIVDAAARKRFDEHIESKEEHTGRKIGEADRVKFERAYVEHIGHSGSVEMVALMLKESPLLNELATKIYEAAKDLAESDKALDEGPPELKKEKTADELNQEFISKAGELFFAHDPAVYWGGISKLIGEAEKNVGLFEAMQREHCNRDDADVPFEARNYGTHTSSRVEWFFVARPDEVDVMEPYLRDLGHPARYWPQGIRGHDKRNTMKYDEYQQSKLGRQLTAGLGIEGEQPMSEPEFIVLRAYTGPLFEKYNCILRASNAAFFRQILEGLGCKNNPYETTITVLSAAIVKLSKLTYVPVVYRAPGRALSTSFGRMHGMA